jgi:hypothetical protein
MRRNVFRRLKQLETRAKEVAAARPEPNTLCFIDPVNKRVAGTYDMATGKWTQFDLPRGSCRIRADHIAVR